LSKFKGPCHGKREKEPVGVLGEEIGELEGVGLLLTSDKEALIEEKSCNILELEGLFSV